MNWKHKMSRFPPRMIGDTVRTWNLGFAIASSQYAIKYHGAGMFEDAVEEGGNAVCAWRRIAMRWNGELNQLGHSLDFLTATLFKLGRHADAMPLAEESVAVWHIVTASDLDQVVKLASTLHNLGRCLRSLGQHEEALAAFREAHDTLLLADCANLQDLAEITEQVIQTLHTLGRYDDALPLEDDLATLRR